MRPSADAPSAGRHIFISYARDDDEAFAGKLWRHLTEHGFRVWWDRAAMESRGRTFLQEIRDAIATADRVLLIVGPRVNDRPYVEVEWRHALREGVVVTPLLRLGDYHDVPEALRALHCEDVRESVPEADALERVRRIIAASPPPLGPLVGVPRLPTPYLERPGRLDALRSRVLIDAYAPIDLQPDQRITSVTGMPGAGKSVLAAALAQSPEVRRSFADGVYWVPVGRNADLLHTLTRIGLAIGDSATQSYTGVAEARLLLGKALARMNCLLVLDDVWDVAVAEALHAAAGTRVRILLTGRKRHLFASAGVHEVPVDELSPGEALDLLAAWASAPRTALPAEAAEIADECGCLPLALAMIGATIRRHPDRWGYALARLRKADLSRIEGKLPDYVYTTLDRAMLVSFEELDPTLQRRYLDLVAVPEDVAAPAAMLRAWWGYEGMDALDITDVLDGLVDRSLLRVDDQARYTLHDVQRDFLVQRTADESALHARWLAACAAHAPQGWATAADDGYLFDQLGHHLRGAGRSAEWRALQLSLPWLERKAAARGFPAVLLDLAAYATDPAIAPLYRVCRRAAHILTHDPAQLAAQLLARLEPAPALAALLDAARAWRGGTWLRPITRSLSEEGEPTLAVFRGREIDGHAGTPRRIVFSADDRLIASSGGSSNDLTVKIWSVEAARLLRSFSDAISAGGAADLAFIAPDGRVAVADATTVRVYALDADAPIAAHTFDAASITGLCGGDPPGTVWVGFSDGRVVRWDPAGESVVVVRPADGRRVIALACAPAAPRLALALDTAVECRDARDGRLIGRVEQPLGDGGLHFQGPPLVISPDGARVIFGNPPRSWAVGGVAESLKGAAAHVLGLARDGAIALSAPTDRELIAIETATGRHLGHVRNSREFSCAALARDGRTAATGDYEHDIKLWDLTVGGEQAPEWIRRGYVSGLSIADDGRLAVITTETAREILDTHTGAPLKPPAEAPADRLVRRGRPILDPQLEQEVRSRIIRAAGQAYGAADPADAPLGVLAFSIGAGRAVSASLPRTKSPDMEEPPYRGGAHGAPLACWDLANPGEPRLLWGHTSAITCADMTADGALSLSGSRGRLLRLWDLEAGVCRHVLQGHRGMVMACALTDDGRLALSGSEDMTVRLWDLEQGALLFTFATSSMVRACDIARDGSVALAAEVSGRVHTFVIER